MFFSYYFQNLKELSGLTRPVVFASKTPGAGISFYGKAGGEPGEKTTCFPGVLILVVYWQSVCGIACFSPARDMVRQPRRGLDYGSSIVCSSRKNSGHRRRARRQGSRRRGTQRVKGERDNSGFGRATTASFLPGGSPCGDDQRG